MDNPIEKLAARLQLLPSHVRWLYAQEGVIQAVALGRSPKRGPRSRLADSLIGLSSRVGLERPIAAFVNFILLTLTYARQNLARSATANGVLFCCIEALRERELASRFGTMQASPVIKLDERGLSDFFALARVPFLALLREMGAVWREVWIHLDPSSPAIGLKRLYLLSFLLMYGHRFAYLRAWFRQCLSRPGISQTVAFTAASYVSFASVAAGADTIYMEHGLQSRSVVYPDFSRSICFNGFDAEQIRRRLPQCAVTVAIEPAQFLATRRIAAVAGDYFKREGFDLIRPFIDWAVRNDLAVIVRKHPMDSSGYWEQWRGVAGVEITDGGGSFAEFLDRFRPRLLASWFSTTLFEAIVKGIVPITVTPESDDEAVSDTVFPFRDLALCWPRDEGIAQALLDDDKRRAVILTDNYARVAGT